MRVLEARRLRWFLGALVFLAGFVVPAGAADAHRTFAPADSIVWSSVFKMIELKWPAVKQVTTAELARRVAAREAVLVIDTREKEEYLVSHLPGAIWAESASQLRTAVRSVPATQLIVLYCSVGVRSSKAAAMLMREGGHSVANLRGSIFQWANEGRPLEVDGRPATQVHPYNRIWGRLLDARLRAPKAP